MADELSSKLGVSGRLRSRMVSAFQKYADINEAHDQVVQVLTTNTADVAQIVSGLEKLVQALGEAHRESDAAIGILRETQEITPEITNDLLDAMTLGAHMDFFHQMDPDTIAENLKKINPVTLKSAIVKLDKETAEVWYFALLEKLADC